MKTKELLERLKELGYIFIKDRVLGQREYVRWFITKQPENDCFAKYPYARIIPRQKEKYYQFVILDNRSQFARYNFTSGKETLLFLYKLEVKERLRV